MIASGSASARPGEAECGALGRPAAAFEREEVNGRRRTLTRTSCGRSQRFRLLAAERPELELRPAAPAPGQRRMPGDRALVGRDQDERVNALAEHSVGD